MNPVELFGLRPGTLNILVGELAVGKTILCLDLAARFTRGTPPGFALILSADDPKSIIVSRLHIAGADPNLWRYHRNLFSKETDIGWWFSLKDDLAKLETYLQRYKVRLLIIDPVPAYSGSITLKTSLRLLTDLAASLDIAILATMPVYKHQSRFTDEQFDSRYGADHRSVLVCRYCQRDPTLRVVSDAFSFRIIDTAPHSIVRVEYEDAPDPSDRPGSLLSDAASRRAQSTTVPARVP